MEKRLERFFPLDLAGVDVALDEHDRTAESLRLRRRRHQRTRRNDEWQITSFYRAPHRPHPYTIACFCLERVEKIDDVLV